MRPASVTVRTVLHPPQSLQRQPQRPLRLQHPQRRQPSVRMRMTTISTTSCPLRRRLPHLRRRVLPERKPQPARSLQQAQRRQLPERAQALRLPLHPRQHPQHPQPLRQHRRRRRSLRRLFRRNLQPHFSTTMTTMRMSRSFTIISRTEQRTVMPVLPRRTRTTCKIRTRIQYGRGPRNAA